MRRIILSALVLVSCEQYVDNDEYLPPIDKPMDVQVREMFEFINTPLTNYDNTRKKESNN